MFCDDYLTSSFPDVSKYRHLVTPKCDSYFALVWIGSYSQIIHECKHEDGTVTYFGRIEDRSTVYIHYLVLEHSSNMNRGIINS